MITLTDKRMKLAPQAASALRTFLLPNPHHQLSGSVAEGHNRRILCPGKSAAQWNVDRHLKALSMQRLSEPNHGSGCAWANLPAAIGATLSLRGECHEGFSS
jgi:hypothetical protein